MVEVDETQLALLLGDLFGEGLLCALLQARALRFQLFLALAVGLALLGPPALGMGLGFPLGLRLVARFGEDESRPALGPWLWGINGACGVCASGLALGSSMTWGIPVTLFFGALCYFALLFCTRKLAV